MRYALIGLLSVLLLYSVSFAQEKRQLPASEIQKLESLDKLKDQAKELQVILEKMTKDTYYKCLKSFGNDSFCKCLSDSLPMKFGFEEYITIMINRKEDLDYDKMSPEDKKAVDLTYQAREKCVNQAKR